MLSRLRDAIRPSPDVSLARAFARLGWAGFWLQVVFGSLPITALIFFLVFSRSASATPSVSRSGLAFVEYLTIANLVVLIFTIFWSYRYTMLARHIADAQKRPSQADVVSSVWTGVVANMAGMIFSMIVIFLEAASLLFLFLKAPQAGIPVIQTAGAAAPAFVSSVDMVSLMALILILCAEIVVLVFNLWLLFRTSAPSAEYPAQAGV